MTARASAIRVAQLGCGYWGPNLLRNLAVDDLCHLEVVAEPDASRRSYVAENFPSVRVVDNPKSVIADPSIDAVVIATPAGTHEELALSALAVGKHVLSEKPIATSLAGARRVQREAESAGRVLMVGHTFLYNAAVRCLRDVVTRGELGDLYYVYGQRANLGQLRSDVNAWWNLAPHDVSILLYLRDGRLPKTVTATGLTLLQPGIQDVVFAALEWDDGVAAHLHVSWLDPGKLRRMTVVGSRKMAIYDDLADDKVEIWDKGIDWVPRVGERMDFDRAGPPVPTLRSGDREVPEIRFEEPLKVEIRHFLECIRDGSEPLTGAQHAVDVVAVLEAVDAAMQERRAVELPIIDKSSR